MPKANEARGLIFAGISGVLLTLSFPPIGAWPLAFIALVPLIHAVLDAPDAKAAANFAAVCGLVFYSTSLFWLFKVFGPMVVAFWCVFSLWLALHAALLWKLDRRWPGRSALFVLGAGVFWTGLEYLRSELTGKLDCSWLALGYTQTGNIPVLQSCSLVGLYGLSALIVCANSSIVLALRRRWRPAAAMAVLLLALGLWGRRRAADPAVIAGKMVTAAVVQDESFDVAQLAKLSASDAARKADILVWPEYSFTVSGREDGFLKLLARSLAGSKAVAILGGAIFPEDMKHGREQNFAWVLSPKGELLGRYDKTHPIPYVERLLPPNPDPKPVDTPLGRLGVQICYDLDFENVSRAMARQGAQALIVPDLDPREWPAWQHEQHSAMSPARAVESGLWIARAASSGLSQLIDPAGRVTAALPAMTTGTLVGTIALRAGGTAYTRIGWLLSPACLILTAIFVLRLLVGSLRETTTLVY